MAFTELLAVGTGAANSADVTVAAGSNVVFALKGTNGVIPLGAMVTVTYKADDGRYYPVQPDGKLHEGRRSMVLDAKGVYRVSRAPSSPAVGVTHEVS